MQVCRWDVSEGRSELVESVWTGSVGFCQCSLLETSPANYLLAYAGEQTEEVRHQQCQHSVVFTIHVHPPPLYQDMLGYAKSLNIKGIGFQFNIFIPGLHKSYFS